MIAVVLVLRCATHLRCGVVARPVLLLGEKWLDAEIEKVRKIALEDIDNIKSAFVNSYPYNQNYKPRK